MARFDVYANPFAPERTHTPLVLDVQNDHLGPLATRVVIPLRTTKAMDKPARGLNPVLEIDGRALVLDTASLAPVPLAMLKRGVPLERELREPVIDALDTLFGSY
jgi:toxin CcdB